MTSRFGIAAPLALKKHDYSIAGHLDNPAIHRQNARSFDEPSNEFQDKVFSTGR